MALLEARGITKIFGKLTALNGAELTVAENEFHGLIGPNGSGKSTLMKCVAGAEVLTTGTVTFGGHDITQAPPAERARAGRRCRVAVLHEVSQHMGSGRGNLARPDVRHCA